VPTHGIVLDQQGPVPVAAPVAVRIPAHDVVSRVVPVGVDQGTGELSVPADPAQVGWYQFGATPGAAGAAVLAGHVDWKGRPGAFIHLDEVQPGERIEVDLGDGTSHAFVVAETHLILKTELPPDLFARTGPSKLVLITCGGEFDRSVRRYKQNVVVVATPAP
jgi:sortase (surface protein transpeptidase)